MLDVVPGPQGGSLGDVLELIRGDTKSWTGTVYAPDGVTLLDLSDYAIQFTAKRRAVDPDAGAVFLKTVLDGITVTGPGKYQIDMMPWDSAPLPPKSLALGFDVQIANSASNVRTIERGLLKVLPDSSIGTSLEDFMTVTDLLTAIDAKLATLLAGVSTAAKQDTQEATLTAIGTLLAGASTAANQATANTSLAAIATAMAGAATAAKQDTGNASLATIATQTALGAGLTQTIAQHSVPTVTADQIAAGAAAVTHGVLLAALDTNTDNVWIVQSGGAVGAGVRLGPGDSVFLQITNPQTLYCISASTGQNVFGVGL